MPLTTSTDGVPSVVGGADEAKYVIAPEVVSLSFSYYDGLGWQTSWNGADKPSNQTIPQGPPLAIAMSFELETPGVAGEAPRRRKFHHVIAIPTANNGTPTTSDQSQAQDQ